MTEAPLRKSVLVVIDVQNDVMVGAWQADAIVARIATLIQRARQESVPVIYVQHEDAGMPSGSIGWKIVDAIAPCADDMIVHKRFQDAFAETTLGKVLAGFAAGHLVVAGAQTDACVRATTLRALVEGFDLTLVEDAHTTNDATFDMPDGEVVAISAKQIIAHTNMCLHGISYPGVTCRIAPHTSVAFTTRPNKAD